MLRRSSSKPARVLNPQEATDRIIIRLVLFFFSQEPPIPKSSSLYLNLASIEGVDLDRSSRSIDSPALPCCLYTRTRTRTYWVPIRRRNARRTYESFHASSHYSIKHILIYPLHSTPPLRLTPLPFLLPLRILRRPPRQNRRPLALQLPHNRLHGRDPFAPRV